MTDATRPPRPYRVPRPDRSALIEWPPGFGTRFTVFCDVEEEFDWRRPLDRNARATTAMAAFPAAHRRFAAAGVGLACMIDHPVACDPAAAAMLAEAAEDRRTTIGAQLHPWVNPPFAEPVTPANSYAGNLPRELEAAKIDLLTATIEERVGRRPTAYRAGRYGIGPATLRLLAERGYRIDSSVRARYDYRGDGGPDFRSVGNHAYRDAGLIELPFTTVFTGAARRWGAGIDRAARRLPHGPGLLARSGLLSRVALTPEDMPIVEAMAAVEGGIDDGVRLLVFSFHSPSLAPGHTPYVRDADDLGRFWSWWDAMLERLAARGVTFASLDDILVAAG